MGTKLQFCILQGATFYWRRRLPRPFKMSMEFSLGTKDLRVVRGLFPSPRPSRIARLQYCAGVR